MYVCMYIYNIEGSLHITFLCIVRQSFMECLIDASLFLWYQNIMELLALQYYVLLEKRSANGTLVTKREKKFTQRTIGIY